MPGWADLSTSRRTELLKRYDNRENIEDLAREVEMRPGTLARRLRGWRKKRPPDEPEPTKTDLKPGETRVLANPTDVHGVYADPYAWELGLRCIEAMQPDVITWGNDCMDFGTISKWARVTKLPTLGEELKDEKKRREEVCDAASAAEVWWIADNHTLQRYQTYIWNRAPDLADLDILQFHKLIDFPEDRIVECFEAGDTLRVIHGTYVRKWPGSSVLAEIVENPANRKNRVLRSVMSGHTHRFALVSLDNGIEGLECGCMQDLRPKYIKASRRHTNWTHGLGFARYGPDWSCIIPARFFVHKGRLRCRLEGQELSVKITKNYSGYS